MESIHRGAREMCWLLAETAAAQRAVWEEQSCAFKWGVFKQSFQLVHGEILSSIFFVCNVLDDTQISLLTKVTHQCL